MRCRAKKENKYSFIFTPLISLHHIDTSSFVYTKYIYSQLPGNH